jgi:hypothetical protein
MEIQGLTMLFPEPPDTPSTPLPPRTALVDVMACLRDMRLMEAGLDEADIQDRILALLIRAGFPAQREKTFAPGCRADIWIDGIVIEVKKTRPDRPAVRAQITRYAAHKDVRAVVLVLERNVVLPETISAKPIHTISLNSLWGIAL